MNDLFMALAPQLRLVHALAAFALVAGLVGRWVLLSRAEGAAREQRLGDVTTLVSAATVFERTVIISSLIVIALGLLTAWSYGYPLLGFLQGGTTNWLLAAFVLSMTLFALVPAVFVPKGKVFDAAMSESTSIGRPSANLIAAFGDPVLRAAHVYELGVIAVVLVLMILKPF
jgi:hypothetical protein